MLVPITRPLVVQDVLHLVRKQRVIHVYPIILSLDAFQGLTYDIEHFVRVERFGDLTRLA